MERVAIGIDIGGQSSKCGVVTESGTILAQKTVTSLIDNPQDYVSLLSDTIQELTQQTVGKGVLAGIGIGAPNANYMDGTIQYAPNLLFARDSQGSPISLPLAAMLSEATNLPVRITNDANAAALGERAYGVARGLDDFIMITLGTGVGGGIVTGGRLLYGHDGFAGECGHICVVPNGRECNCGLKGCLETYTSAMGVARTARQFLTDDSRDSLLRTLDPQSITALNVAQAAKKGDAMARDIFTYTGRLLGHALGDLVKFSSPSAIVLFGGLTKSREFFHDAMVQAMNDNLMQIWKNRIQILYSSLRESDAAILGASSLVW